MAGSPILASISPRNISSETGFAPRTDGDTLVHSRFPPRLPKHGSLYTILSLPTIPLTVRSTVSETEHR